MGEAVSNIYSIMILLAFGFAISYARILYEIKRKPLLRILVILFSVYMVDQVIIFMTEINEMSAYTYNSIFLKVPSIKTVIMLTTGVCLVYIINIFLNQLWHWGQSIYLGIFLIVLLFIPMIPNHEAKFFAYFTTYQIFTLGLILYSLNKIQDKHKYIRQLIYLTFIGIIMIILEDVIVIFFYDSYAKENLFIRNRNTCEDALRIVYAVYTIKYCRKEMCIESIITKEILELKKNEEPLHIEIKVDSFTEQYHFTEREKEVFKLIHRGKGIQEISDKLFIAPGTVKAHLHKIYQKTDVSRKKELIELFELFRSI